MQANAVIREREREIERLSACKYLRLCVSQLCSDQLTSVLDINLTLTLDVGFTSNFGHPTSQPKFNQISTSYDRPSKTRFGRHWVKDSYNKALPFRLSSITQVSNMFT